MKKLLLFMFLVCLPMLRAEEPRLYQDAEIRLIQKKFKSHDKPNYMFGMGDLLSIVPAGETKPLELIFRALGLDSTRLSSPEILGLNSVDFHIWKVSPNFELSIMVARNDPNNDSATQLKLKGYGVRLREKNKR